MAKGFNIVNEAGKHIGAVINGCGTALLVGTAGVCSAGYFASDWIARTYGPEDVLPIMVGGTGLVCVGTIVLGGIVYYIIKNNLTGETRLTQAYNNVRSQVYGEGGPAIVPSTPAGYGAQPEISPLQADPVGTVASGLHFLVIGFTGGGKTTFMHALGMHWIRQGHPVHVLDPDAAPGMWPGAASVVGGGDRFDDIEIKIQELGEIIRSRRQARAEAGVRHFNPIYVIMEEAGDILHECPSAQEFFEGMLRRGRKLDMHLGVGTQDALVETLGIQGKSELRRQFTYVVELRATPGPPVQRSMTVMHNWDKETAETFYTPRLPDPEKLIVEYRSSARTADQPGPAVGQPFRPDGPPQHQGTDSTGRVGGAETGQNGPKTAPQAQHQGLAPVPDTLAPAGTGAKTGRSTGGSVPSTGGSVQQHRPAPAQFVAPQPQHHSAPAVAPAVTDAAIAGMLVDEAPSEVHDDVTRGQVRAIAYALLVHGEDWSANEIQRQVFGYKSSKTHQRLGEVMAKLPADLVA